MKQFTVKLEINGWALQQQVETDTYPFGLIEIYQQLYPHTYARIEVYNAEGVLEAQGFLTPII